MSSILYSGRKFTGRPARPISLISYRHRNESTINAMTARPITIPGPEHPIAIERDPKRVRVSVGGRIGTIEELAE